MSTRLAALRAEAAASTAPVTASPRRLGLPASATRTAICATRAPIAAISSGTMAAASSASFRSGPRLASTAVSMDWEGAIFFTFYGLDIIKKSVVYSAQSASSGQPSAMFAPPAQGSGIIQGDSEYDPDYV